MNPELITRLVKLVEKTGDRVILPDLESGKAVVVMDLDAYERLCTTDVAVPVPAVVPAPPARSAVAMRTEEQGSEGAEERPQRTQATDRPNKSANKGKIAGLEDLTQEELLDRINRDIDAWKTAQDAKRTQELQAAARETPSFELAAGQLEEEERFFLEPIE